MRGPYGTLRWDLSVVGHFAESVAIMLLLSGAWYGASILPDYAWLDLHTVPWYGWKTASVVGALVAFWIYVGREKRDCETGWHDGKGNKLKSGDPRAWYLMWWRWQNILDMAGPILLVLLSLAALHDVFL